MDSSTNSLDDAPADSGADSTERAAPTETRLRAQEDELTLLKASLADALRRIRLHDGLLLVLKQQLIAVNPAAAGLINQICCHEGASIYSSLDRVLLCECSQTPRSISGPATADRSTQTEAGHPEPKAALSGGAQSLHLEDPLPLRAKLHRAPSVEEDEDPDDHDGAAQRETEPTRTAAGEEPVWTSAGGPQNGRDWPEDTSLDQNLGPLSSVRQEAQHKPLLRRNSEKLGNLKRQVKRLDRKAASSATLLSRSPSLENRVKELVASAGSPGSRRRTYGQGQSIKMFIRGRPITMYVPSAIQNYHELKTEPPSQSLELDWVYGYRGRDCRANLYTLPTGEAVYFVARVVVLYHMDKRTQRHYRRHSDCVRCLALHPDKVRIASGQTAGVDKDGKPLQPCVHIWDSTTLVTLQQIGLGTFQRGVVSVAFSTMDSGVFLCVIDESNEHMLSVWDCAKGSKQAEVKTTNETVFAVDFHPGDSGNIITCGKSHVYFWTLSAGQFTKKQGIFGKYKKPKFIQCFVFSLTGDVLTGDSEGNILTWGRSAADVRTLGKGAKETFQIMRQTKAHEGSVFTLCALQGGAALLSGGSKDRKIIRWSADLAPEHECEIPEKFGAIRTLADVDGEEVLVGTSRNAILRGAFSTGFVAVVQGHVDELWGLATHPSLNGFLSCGHDRQVCLWNAEEHALRWSVSLEEYGLCADFCPNGSVVSVGLSTGRWVVLDLLTAEVISEAVDGNEQHSVMRYSPDGSFLAVGSHDNFIYIYNVTENGRSYTRFGRCNGHSSFITHLDWSKDGKYIMSNSGDYEILYWDVAAGCKLLRNRSESKDREWASYTCVLGFHVMGVWPEGSDGTDINALCRSHSESVVAVADDFCKVHLFQYPCPKLKAPSRRYEGHGSHVTNVRFTHSDAHLLSVGGKDTCIFQWRVLPAGSPEPAPSSH
ncbi:echinoderm microtubule-associated protein-like 3 isoform X1 [Syngnathus acus]|uniref:echinoderm microtubule-associated protein-like 3 isoform X1 n=1 Tax=Syngnathus acus TaxID=161584 RepID=UPI0018861F24|nr:echinoderm microtubule-associated protein-like 3 isoform X1 [Syngnathus acus]